MGLEDVRSVIGADAFPEDPDLIAVHPNTREQGVKLIGMMGLCFDGDGESRSRASAPELSTKRLR
ncbi:hypothetical protein [Rhodopseudomonas sp.]|uniref:hypothetical protein n=1 Tax=Rhodopseudomonas sp. TaxID=1078 RepID=UPI0039E5CD7C